MQRGGQALGLRREFAVADLAAEEDQRGLVGVAAGADREVVPQRGGRQGDRMGQALGPEFVMRALHAGEPSRAEPPRIRIGPRGGRFGDAGHEAVVRGVVVRNQMQC